MPKKLKARKRRTVKVKVPKSRKTLEKLEKEKMELAEKNKHLLQIIETISKSKEEEESDIEAPISEEEESDTEKEKAEDGEEKPEKEKPLSILKNFEEKVKNRLEESKSKEDMKKDISKMVKEKMDSQFSKMSEDMKKISNLEDKINKLTEKITGPQPVPAPQLVAPEAYGPGGPTPGAVSKELASFGAEVDLQAELNEIKRNLKDVHKNLDNLKKKTDYSITNISDKMKMLDKIPALEENFQTVSEKLGPDNVQKLRKLIFSADELVDEVIPDLVTKRMRTRMVPAINEIAKLKRNFEGVRSALNNIKSDILNLQKTKEDIKELELEKDRLYKEIITRDVKFREGVDILKGNIKKKMDSVSAELSEKLSQAQAANYEKIEKDISKIFNEVIQLKIEDIDKNYGKVSEKIKKMILTDEKLSKRISELKAPEGVKKWVRSQLKDVIENTIPEIKSIRKDILGHLEQMKSLRDEIRNLNSFSVHMSKTAELQKEGLEKLSKEKSDLADMIDELKADAKVLDEKILLEKERIKGIESDMRAKQTEFGTTLDKHKSVMSDFRLEVVKMIEESIKTLKEELEEERMEDIKNYTNELKSDILRIEKIKEELENYKKKQEEKFDKLTSNLKDIPPDVKTLGGRIESLETIAKRLEKEKINESEFSSIVKLITRRVGEIEDHFDEIESKITKDKSIIEKTVNDLLSGDRIIKSTQELIGKDFLKRTDALAEEMKSLSGKLSADKDKLNELEQTVSLKSKETDSKINSISSDLLKVDEGITSEIDAIRAKLGEIEALGTSLRDKAIDESEFVSTVKSISKRIDDVEKLYSELDKKSVLDKTKLQIAINQALSDDKVLKSAQESLGKWIQENIQVLGKRMASDMNKLSRHMEERSEGFSNKVYSDIEKFSTQLSEHSQSIMNLKERLSTLALIAKQSEEQEEKISKLKEGVHILNSLTKEFPKKFEQQSKELKDIMGTSGFFSKRIDSLDSDLDNVNDKIESSMERLTSLDKDFRSNLKSQESRLDGIDKNFAGMRGDLQSSALEIGVLKERIDDMEKRFEQSVKKSMEEKHILKEELKKQGERVGRILKELSE